jgi:hypothetical protein
MSNALFFRILTRSLAAGTLLLTVSVLPAPVHAQDPPAQNADKKNDSATKLADKRVTLQVEEASLTNAIRMLMKSVGADFSIDPALREARVTANLTNIRLQVALDTLMRISTVPASYRVAEGVYLFEPRKEEPPTPPLIIEEDTKSAPKARFETIKVRNVDPSYLAALLGGQGFSVMGQNYGAFGGDFSGSRTFSNGGFGGSGLFGGSGGANLGNSGNQRRDNGNNGGNSSFDFRNGLGNLLNLFRGGGNRGR